MDEREYLHALRNAQAAVIVVSKVLEKPDLLPEQRGAMERMLREAEERLAALEAERPQPNP